MISDIKRVVIDFFPVFLKTKFASHNLPNSTRNVLVGWNWRSVIYVK